MWCRPVLLMGSNILEVPIASILKTEEFSVLNRGTESCSEMLETIY
jgi:hypothetical protein